MYKLLNPSPETLNEAANVAQIQSIISYMTSLTEGPSKILGGYTLIVTDEPDFMQTVR